MKKVLLLVATSAFASFVSAQVVINEIRIDQPGTDNQEYFELSGSFGTSLNTLTYIVIGDGATFSGTIEAVVSLAGLSIPVDGHFLGAESSWATTPPALWPGGVPDATFGTLLNFENGDNVTHLLVDGFTGANGNDLDTNDDGVLDSTPWSSILDSVALIVDPTFTTSERVYSSTMVGPDGIFVPGHIYRSHDTSGPWKIGPFDGTVVGWHDTPGTTNPVPEPASLVALGLGALALLRRKRKNA